MLTKLEILRGLMAAGNHVGALKLAAKWQDLGKHKAEITRGWAAASNPQFYRDLNQDPAAHVAAGVAAIKERYHIA